MQIIIPLHNETLMKKIPLQYALPITTSDIGNEYDNIFYAEIAKFLYSCKHNLVTDDVCGFMQNRRYLPEFNKFEKLIKDGYVIVPHVDNTTKDVSDHFKMCHPDIYNIFMKNLTDDERNIFENLIKGEHHNIFVSSKNFFYNYGCYLNEKLTKMYNDCLNTPKLSKMKHGAWMAERLLMIFRKKYNIKSIHMNMITLSKN